MDLSGNILEEIGIRLDGTLIFNSAQEEGAVSLGIKRININDLERSTEMGERRVCEDIEFEAVRNLVRNTAKS